MKKNQAVLLMNHQAFIDEVQQMLSQHKAEIVKALSKRNDAPFTREELSKYLKVCPQTIINWGIEGKLNPKFIGSRVYYEAEEVNNLLKSEIFPWVFLFTRKNSISNSALKTLDSNSPFLQIKHKNFQ
jgi:DNA-binding XRE family transcriptional regulator